MAIRDSFALDEGSRALQDTLRGLLAGQLSSAALRSSLDTGTGYDTQLHARLAAELGLAGLTIPEEFGGLGMSQAEAGVVHTELGRALYPGPFLASGLAAAALLEAGHQAAAQYWLPRLADGSVTGTVAAAGEDGHWSPGPGSVQAGRSAQGWYLRGTRWVAQRRPVRAGRDPVAEVGLRDGEDVLVREFVRHPDPLLGVRDHPHRRGHDRYSHLHGRRVLVGDQAARLADGQVASHPPGLVGVAHDEGAEDVRAPGDLVVHDAQPRLQLVAAAAQLVERNDRLVAGAVGVVDRGPVGGLFAVPDRERVRYRERLAVPDHHALDGVVGDPRAHPGVDAHARDADLVPRAALVPVGVGGQRLLVGAPAQLGRGRPLLAEPLDAPRVHELVDLLRHVGDLGVALAAVDDLDAQLPGELVEPARGDEPRQRLGLPALGLALADHRGRDVDQALPREGRDQAGVGAVLDDRGRALAVPLGVHAAHVHVAPVEGALRGVLPAARIRVPDLHGCIYVKDTVVVAPLKDHAGVDVPRQVDQEVAGRELLAQERGEVLLRHALP